MTMSDVINLEEQERDWVRFFREHWDCDWCGMPTRGRVYEETQTVVCSACRKPLLEIDSDPQHYIEFEEDFD
jgi:hypothetical protein